MSGPAAVDVVVVGSGAGGMPVATTLAERGFRVVVLERGPWLRREDFLEDEVAVKRRGQLWPADRSADVFRAAGATRVDVPPLGVRKLHNHQMGTCRMGDDPGRSVVDRWCRIHGVPNAYVTDASVFVTSGGLNPALTIQANAFRVADHIATTRS